MRDKKILLSVVTVNYNSGRNLFDTLNFFLKFADYPFEIIIVDNQSTDNSLDMIKLLPIKNIRIIAEKDFGIYDAMNKGVKYCKGDWVWFLNSGDQCVANFSEIIYFLDSVRDKFNFVYSDFIVGNGVLIPQKFSLFTLLRGTINHQTIIYGRDIFPNFKIKYGLSADFADLLSSYRKILPIKFHSPLIKYDLDGKSSNLSRRIRFSVWLGRLIAFRDGNLPFFYKIFAIAFSIIVILIKTINPKAFSNTNRYRSSP